jgi:prophage regulatory protein
MRHTLLSYPIFIRKAALALRSDEGPSNGQQLSISIAMNERPAEVEMPGNQRARSRRQSADTLFREMVPLADSTIYEMEQRGEFPRRFALSPRCVVWDLAEVEAWLASRRSTPVRRAQSPDVR